MTQPIILNLNGGSNRTRQTSLLDAERPDFNHVLDIALSSLNVQAAGYNKKILAFSGGKDSTTTVTLVAWAIATGRLTGDWQPKNTHVIYSDTGQELPPLHQQALRLLAHLQAEGYQTEIVRPVLEERFFVRMLGRGLPVPGGSFRWCVGGLKVKPIETRVRELFAQNNQEKMLVVSGVRKNESQARDQRIFSVCSKYGECGTGVWQPVSAAYDLLAPIAEWRTCHVFDWLADWLPAYGFDKKHGYPTQPVAKIYGDQDIRTGCNGCPVASRDWALEYAVKNLPECASLAPLLRLRELWEGYRTRRHFRLHNDGSGPTRAKDLGPLTFEAREWGFNFLEELQADIYRLGGTYQILSQEEKDRIKWHWANQTWPHGWNGTQPVGDIRQLLDPNQSEINWFGE